MIAHVAEAGEGRGRVVLQLSASCRLSTTAVEAAVRVAQAFQSEIESLFVEDSRLFDIASYPFAREIAHSGRSKRALSIVGLEQGLNAAAHAMHRRIVELARRAEVPVHCRTMRDSVEAALAIACAENGPWNVVAIAEPLDAGRAASIPGLLAAVAGTTGIVLAGRNARRISGPVVALVEDAERVAPMLRAAERLASVSGGEARLVVVAGNADDAHWIEAQARLALGADISPATLAGSILQAEPLALAESLRRMECGFVIAQFGGMAVPAERELAVLAGALEGPMLLVR